MKSLEIYHISNMLFDQKSLVHWEAKAHTETDDSRTLQLTDWIDPEGWCSENGLHGHIIYLMYKFCSVSDFNKQVYNISWSHEFELWCMFK